MARPSHIFVVGCPRSGTTLVARILDASPDVSFIQAETKFVGGLLRPGLRHKMRSAGDRGQDSNVRRLVDSIYADDATGGCYAWLRGNVDREQLLRRLLASDRSDRAVFAAMLDIQAARAATAAPIAGEKTPAHVYHVPLLLAWFPAAIVVHILRDPRAVLVSQLRRRRGDVVRQFSSYPLRSLNPLFVAAKVGEVTVAWRRAAALHYAYLQRFGPSYYALRYEELVSEPEANVRKLCAAVGIDFAPSMLEQRIINSSFTTEHIAGHGFERAAIRRWEGIIEPWMRSWIEVATQPYRRRLGYGS